MKWRRTKHVVPLAIVGCALALAVPATAAALTTQTFTTSQSEFTPGVRNQGWWGDPGGNVDTNDNYVVSGHHFFEDRTRNFFSFDLSSACPASGVTLQLTRFEQFGPADYWLFDVSTPAATLNANNGASQAIFDDLGSGTSFGMFPVGEGAVTDVLSFPLNAAGVAAFNAARGGFFSIGGMTPSEATNGNEALFGASGGPNGTQQLVVTCALPTTKDQCKNGGWRNFPGFKNQGDCVSSVATGGKNQPSRP